MKHILRIALIGFVVLVLGGASVVMWLAANETGGAAYATLIITAWPLPLGSILIVAMLAATATRRRTVSLGVVHGLAAILGLLSVAILSATIPEVAQEDRLQNSILVYAAAIALTQASVRLVYRFRFPSGQARDSK